MSAALVTGGGTRLGRAMALCLGRRGYDVAVHYNTSGEAAGAVADEIRAMGPRAAPVHADLLDNRDTDTLVARAADAVGGPLTVLVNNASVFERDEIGTITAESWERHVGSNLRAPVFLTQSFALQAPEAGRDARGEPVATALVVNMVDQRVRKTTPHFATYTIAKMGLWDFTRTAAQALAPAIRVNAIGPGPTLQGARQSDAHFAAQRAATVLGRGAGAEDIVAALVYFLDAPAVTGQLLCVDGGQHLGWRTPDVSGPE